MENNANIDDTVPRPYGGEIYAEFTDAHGQRARLTYNDLWMLIVCRMTMHGDWTRTHEAAALVPDSERKRAMVERLRQLDADGVLPELPQGTVQFNLHRAHVWFNQRYVSESRSR